MKPFRWSPVAVLLFALAACDGSGAGSTAAEDWQELEVAWHVDGDTVGVRVAEDGPAGRAGGEVSVRLLEVDTPEVHPVGECFGPEAAAELARLLPRGSTVWGEPDEELRDQYGRTLLYLYADLPGDGVSEPVLVNEHLVAQGFGRAVLFAPNDRHIDALREAEREARASSRGLWGACG